MSFLTSPLMRRLRPGFATVLADKAPFASAWEAANALALAATGPLWVALGDSTAQGIGAPAYDRGYVGQLLARLRERDRPDWRVLNLSVSGARVGDVVAGQLPQLDRFVNTAELLTCAVGANDVIRPGVGVAHRTRTLIARLPPGTVLATIPHGLMARRTDRLNDVIRAEAPRAGLRLADVWACTGPPWRGKFAVDDFHPNERGYTDWADAFAEALSLGPLSPRRGV